MTRNVASLERVAHALGNVTRNGETFAVGITERFPLPGLAFKSDVNDGAELVLPLRMDDIQTIKTRATVLQSPDGEVHTWEVSGDALGFRNPWWREFLDEGVSCFYNTMGIAPTAIIELSLRKLRLVERGGKLDAKEQRDGVFGSLIAVLPGAVIFEGVDEAAGEYKHDQDDRKERETISRTSIWRTNARRTPYDLTCTAFYDSSKLVANPVASGTAVCLVYDLVTTTPSDVPLFAGSLGVQNAVNEALADYFDVMPPALTTRHTISPDAWRTINEFAAERHFVHVMSSHTVEDLNHEDHQIAQSLASFCAQSGG